MKSTRQIKTRRQRLLEKAKRNNDKSNRLQRKIQREMQKRIPKMSKVMKWQEKSVRYVNRGLRYMNEFDAQGEDNREQTEISLVCVKGMCIQFWTKKNDKRFNIIGRCKWKTNHSYRIHFYL